jgi:hypothetical protein
VEEMPITTAAAAGDAAEAAMTGTGEATVPGTGKENGKEKEKGRRPGKGTERKKRSGKGVRTAPKAAKTGALARTGTEKLIRSLSRRSGCLIRRTAAESKTKASSRAVRLD